MLVRRFSYACVAVRRRTGSGKEFLDGLHAIGHTVPVRGIMASIPYLSRCIALLVGPAFSAIADPAGRHVADRGRHGWISTYGAAGPEPESWTIAMITAVWAQQSCFRSPWGSSCWTNATTNTALGIMSGCCRSRSELSSACCSSCRKRKSKWFRPMQPPTTAADDAARHRRQPAPGWFV